MACLWTRFPQPRVGALVTHRSAECSARFLSEVTRERSETPTLSRLMILPDIRIGCSGWQYTHWRRDFYPAELRQSEWFEFYAAHFDTVEINNSFYRLPDAETFARWREQAPQSFLYSVKASRYLTHMKKLKDAGDPLDRFFSNARELGRRLGPVLFQLPPRWPINLERFEAFLVALDQCTRALR